MGQCGSEVFCVTHRGRNANCVRGRRGGHEMRALGFFFFLLRYCFALDRGELRGKASPQIELCRVTVFFWFFVFFFCAAVRTPDGGHRNSFDVSNHLRRVQPGLGFARTAVIGAGADSLRFVTSSRSGMSVQSRAKLGPVERDIAARLLTALLTYMRMASSLLQRDNIFFLNTW